MYLRPEYAIDEGDLESWTYVIPRKTTSEEDVGFGFRRFEPESPISLYRVTPSQLPPPPPGVCCLGRNCIIGFDCPTCVSVGGNCVPGFTSDDCSFTSTGYGPCDCHCMPCQAPPGAAFHESGPSSVVFNWSIDIYCGNCDPFGNCDPYTACVPISGSSGGDLHPMPPCPTASIPSTGFYTTCWFYSTGFPTCDVAFGYNYGPVGDPYHPYISFQLTRYCGFCGDAPIGWFLRVFAAAENETLDFGCTTDCLSSYSCSNTCYYMGDLNVFPPGSAVPFSVTLYAYDCASVQYVTGTVSGTFYTPTAADCIPVPH